MIWESVQEKAEACVEIKTEWKEQPLFLICRALNMQTQAPTITHNTHLLK